MNLLWLRHIALVAVVATATPLEAGQAPGSAPVQIVPNISHATGVNSVDFSPNGRQVVSGGPDSTVKLWDAGTGKLLRTFIGHSESVNAVAFSPDGTIVASGGGDNTLRLWDVVTGRLLRAVSQQLAIHSIHFSPDGKRLFFVGDGLNILDVETGKIIRTIEEEYAVTLAVSRDGSRLASGRQFSNSARLWDSASGKLVRELKDRAPTHVPLATDPDNVLPVAINSLAFTPDGKRIVTGGGDQDLYNPDGVSDHVLNIWDVETGRLLTTFSPHSASIASVAISPSGTIGCSAGDKTIRIWSVEDGKPLRTITTDRISQVAFSPDGKQILSAGAGLQLWDVESGKLVMEFGNANIHSIESASFSPMGDQLAAGTVDEVMDIWDLTTGALRQRFDGGGDLVKFLPDGRRLLAGGREGTKTWTSQDGVPLRNFAAKLDWGASIAVSHGGTTMLVGRNENKPIEQWDIGSGKVVRRYMAFARASSVAFSSDDRVIGAGVGAAAKFWDAESGKLLGAFTPFPNWTIDALTFSHDGKRVLFGGSSRASLATESNLKLADASSGRQLQNFVGHLNAVDSVAMSADDTRALSGSRDGTARLWNVSSGKSLYTFIGSQGAIKVVEFSPDGKRALSAGEDGTIRILNLENGELVVSMLEFGHGDWVTITPEGFFTSSEHGAAHLSVVQGLNVFGIDQVYQSLYRPDLVREKLAGDPRGLVREAAARLDLDKVIASGSAPDVKVKLLGRALGSGSVEANSALAEAEITSRGGGIGRLEWRLNGVTAGIDDAAQAAGAGRPIVRLTRRFALDPGDNAIEVTAYNAANLIASVPASVSVAAQATAPSIAPSPEPAPAAPSSPSPVAASKPRMFALIAGINAYADQRFRLSYAVSDATEIARGLNEAAGNLYRSVEIKLLTDADVTRGKLDAAFAEIAGKATASDTFVLYLAGHGKTLDGRYYFAPQDFAVDGELSDKKIDAAVQAKAIGQDQWQRWFASVPARKSVILFDTCDSGTLAGDETQQLEKGAANDRLAQATGRSILAASGGSQAALEGYRGHGLFTYEVLDAINQADGDRSGTIEVNELAAYVYGQVLELSQKVFKQLQVPQIRITANFPLMKQTRILRDEAPPVALAKPTYQLAQTAQLQIQPGPGATVVRSLSAKTPVNILESGNGWSLIASEGKPLGYVATRDLVPVQ